jgi:FkbM family methyltransferase
LHVTEACFRLAGAGATVIDAGANIGQMTSALAYAVGQAGKVIAFEPHPALFSLLSENVAQTKSQLDDVQVSARQEALSNQSGEADFFVPPAYNSNAGLASMTRRSTNDDKFTVKVTRLDELEIADTVQVMKLDIEGHELAACKGAKSLLRNRQIKNIVFEDFNIDKSEVACYLKRFGYTILTMRGSLRGPYLTDLNSRNDVYNFVATADAEACMERYTSNSWHCLKEK